MYQERANPSRGQEKMGKKTAMVMVPTDAVPGSSPVSSALTAFVFCHHCVSDTALFSSLSLSLSLSFNLFSIEIVKSNMD